MDVYVFLFILRADLSHTSPNHDKCFGMLTQCFCITHNSLSPVLPPIWDRLATEQRQSRGCRCAPGAPAHLSPPAGCSKQSSAVSQSMTMRTKGKRCRSDRHFYPPPTLQGSVCQEGLSFSLYPTPSLTPHHTHLVADKAAVLCLPLRLQSEQQNAHHEHCQLQTFFSFISVRPLYIIVHR